MPTPSAPPGLPGHQPLVVATRGGAVENLHYGSIAVCDAEGRLLAAVGDVGFPVFARSALKPLQALPLLEAGGLEHFGWGDEEAALLCASHSAEPRHLERVARMLHGAGFAEADLQCGAHPPLLYVAADRPPPADRSWTALHNNCSGKHAGFLACCRLRGWDVPGHLAPGHPLQAAIRESVAHHAGIDPARLVAGVDGCNAPTYALPLAALARCYARIADGADPGLARLRDAMTAHPGLVSGRGRSDLALMHAGHGDWVAKVGADGVQALGMRSRGLGIALKIADGNPRAAMVATLSLLRQLGVLPGRPGGALAVFAEPAIRNWRRTVTGRMQAVFRLPGPLPT